MRATLPATLRTTDRCRYSLNVSSMKPSISMSLAPILIVDGDSTARSMVFAPQVVCILISVLRRRSVRMRWVGPGPIAPGRRALPARPAADSPVFFRALAAPQPPLGRRVAEYGLVRGLRRAARHRQCPPNHAGSYRWTRGRRGRTSNGSLRSLPPTCRVRGTSRRGGSTRQRAGLQSLGDRT